MEKCKEDSFNGAFTVNASCISDTQPNLEDNKVLVGTIDLSNLLIIVNKCKQQYASLKNITCKDQATIDEYFDKNGYYVFYTDNVANTRSSNSKFQIGRGIQVYTPFKDETLKRIVNIQL